MKEVGEMKENERKVFEWLNYLKLPSKEYFDKFIEEGWDEIESMDQVDEEDLKGMGITKRGHQKRLLKWLNERVFEENLKIFEKFYSDLTDSHKNNQSERIENEEIEGSSEKVLEGDILKGIDWSMLNNSEEKGLLFWDDSNKKSEEMNRIINFLKSCLVVLYPIASLKEEDLHDEKVNKSFVDDLQYFVETKLHPFDTKVLKTVNMSSRILAEKWLEKMTNWSILDMYKVLKDSLIEVNSYSSMEEVNEYSNFWTFFKTSQEVGNEFNSSFIECIKEIKSLNASYFESNKSDTYDFAVFVFENKEAKVENKGEDGTVREDESELDGETLVFRYEASKKRWYLCNF